VRGGDGVDKVPLLRNGSAAGELTVEREALYTCFSVNCRESGEGLWCAWAVGERGDLRLGVLAPSNGELVLCRRFSTRMTAPVGRILRGEVRAVGEAAEVEWQPACQPECLFRTPWIRRQLRGAQGVLCGRTSACRVAIPYDPSRPFPLAAMFCFARICRIGGKRYAVYCFDAGEQPVMQEKN